MFFHRFFLIDVFPSMFFHRCFSIDVFRRCFDFVGRIYAFDVSAINILSSTFTNMFNRLVTCVVCGSKVMWIATIQNCACANHAHTLRTTGDKRLNTSTTKYWSLKHWKSSVKGINSTYKIKASMEKHRSKKIDQKTSIKKIDQKTSIKKNRWKNIDEKTSTIRNIDWKMCTISQNARVFKNIDFCPQLDTIVNEAK